MPLKTRIVIPLTPSAAMPKQVRELPPSVTIGGEQFVLVMQFLAAVTTREPGSVVGNPAAERDRITRALDLLLRGL